MIKLCVPETDIFRRNKNELLPLVSGLSFKNPNNEQYPGKELMLECSLNVGSPNFQSELINSGLLEALKSNRFTSFACDIGPAWETFIENGKSPNGYPRYLPGTNPLSDEKYLEFGRKNVTFIRDNFKGLIKVENLNYFDTGAYERVCEPEFISMIINELDIELLLDLGHLVICVENMKIPLDSYLNDIPLNKISEIQISGSNIVNGILEDTHEIPNETDIEILDDVLHRIQPKYLTLEYYKNDQALVKGYKYLEKWLQNRE
jgi:hypothetical protein